MTKRQEKILEEIIREYAKHGQAIASSLLAEKFDVSPATMRLEFKALEDEGLLYHPHISSGCAPTDNAYRLFVNKLLSKDEKQNIKFEQELEGIFSDNLPSFVRKSTRKLADNSSGLVLSYFQDLMFKEGFDTIIKLQEFADAERIKKLANIIRSFENEMDDFCNDEVDSDVLVYIGNEINFHDAEDFSILISKWCTADGRRGATAIIGPKRMKYKKNISLIKSVKKMLELK